MLFEVLLGNDHAALCTGGAEEGAAGEAAAGEAAAVAGDNHALPADGDAAVKGVDGSASLGTPPPRVAPPKELLPAAAPKLPANPGTLDTTPEAPPCSLSDRMPPEAQICFRPAFWVSV